jgi:chorismate synthase
MMTRLRWSTAGESHGPRLVALVEGIPAGLALLASDIDADLQRRQRGYGRGGRMKIEHDRVTFQSGVRNGQTLGSPIAMTIENRDHRRWLDRMDAAPLPKVPEPVTRPRPGHVDLAGSLKFDRHDARDVIERASARETAARTAVGAVCRKLLSSAGIEVFAHVISIGDVDANVSSMDAARIRDRARASDLACADPEAESRMRDAILAASHDGDTLGGVFEVIATGVLPGLGSHTTWDRKLDGRLAQALASIQAVKAVAVGDGVDVTRRRGSTVHDSIVWDAERRRFTRPTNRAGGLEGGITNGEPVVCRGYMKPIATLKKALPSVDMVTKEPLAAAHERSDVCAVAAASVVGEAMVCIVLADALLEKFGGDSMRELLRNIDGYRAQLESF